MASKETLMTRLDPDGENVEWNTFEQILEMDDDEEEREFSRGIVFGFFDQARNTFADIDTALKEGNLEQLSKLGHFLKGSSATLGLNKVRDSCEKIQHLGAQLDASGNPVDGKPASHFLGLIQATFTQVKTDYEAAERVLKGFYGV